MNDTKARPYCKPNESGLASEARAVGRKIGKLLDATGTLSRWICEGPIVDDCDSLRSAIIDGLRADGWRVRVAPSDRWQVLPPTAGLAKALRGALIVRCDVAARPDQLWLVWNGGHGVHVHSADGRERTLFNIEPADREPTAEEASAAIGRAIGSGDYPTS